MLQAFQRLELPNEIQTQTDLRSLLRSKRLEFLSAIVNNTDVSNLETLVSVELVKYEEVNLNWYETKLWRFTPKQIIFQIVQQTVAGGLILKVEEDFPSSTEKWSFLQSVFFSSTIITTIGYGNIVPVTKEGRIFCIFFAMIGIPLTLSGTLFL